MKYKYKIKQLLSPMPITPPKITPLKISNLGRVSWIPIILHNMESALHVDLIMLWILKKLPNNKVKFKTTLISRIKWEDKRENT